MKLDKPYRIIAKKYPFQSKIKGYDNYIIGEDGFVYRKLKPRFDINGYEYYDFSNGKGDSERKYIHRIVAETYLTNEDNKPYVNHIDGNKANNDLSKLEWCTPSENSLHSIHVLGNSPKPFTDEHRAKLSAIRKGRYKGKDNPKSIPVICVETGKSYQCIRECAKDVGGTAQGVWDVLHGRYKKHRGLTFKYAGEAK